MKSVIFLLLATVAIASYASPEDWFKPYPEYTSRRGQIIYNGDPIYVVEDENGNIVPERGYEEKFSEWYNKDKKTNANILSALQQGLYSQNDLDKLVHNMEANVITDLKTENGKFYVKKGVSSGSSSGSWIEKGDVNVYNVKSLDSNNASSRTLVDGKGNKVEGSAEWKSADIDGATIERKSNNGIMSVKLNPSGSIVSDGGLKVSLNSNGGIIHKAVGDTTSLSLNLPVYGGTGNFGALALSGNAPGVLITDKEGLRIANGSLGFYMAGGGGLRYTSDGAVEVHTEPLTGAIAQDQDDGLYVYLNADESALSVSDGLLVNVDSKSIDINDENSLSVITGAGIETDEDRGGVSIINGAGLKINEDNEVEVKPKDNDAIVVDSSGVSVKVNDDGAISKENGDGLKANVEDKAICISDNKLSLKLQEMSGMENTASGLSLVHVTKLCGWGGNGWEEIKSAPDVDDSSISSNSTGKLEIKGWSGFGQGILGKTQGGNLACKTLVDGGGTTVGETSANISYSIAGWTNENHTCGADITKMLTLGSDYADTDRHEFLAQYSSGGKSMHYAKFKTKIQDGMSIDKNGNDQLEIKGWNGVASANSIPYKTASGMGWTPQPIGTASSPKALLYNGTAFTWGNAGGGGAFRVYTDGSNGSSGDVTIGAPAAVTNEIQFASDSSSNMKFTISPIGSNGIKVTIGAFYK